MTPADDYVRPHAASAALVLIDMQRDFLDLPGGDAPMPVPGTAGDRGNYQVGDGLPAARAADRACGSALSAGRVKCRPGSAAVRRARGAHCAAGQSRFANHCRTVAQSR